MERGEESGEGREERREEGGEWREEGGEWRDERREKRGERRAEKGARRDQRGPSTPTCVCEDDRITPVPTALPRAAQLRPHHVAEHSRDHRGGLFSLQRTDREGTQARCDRSAAESDGFNAALPLTQVGAHD